MRVRAFLLAVLVLVLFPAAAAADYPHVVQPGETLTSVAEADGVSINAIAVANGISPVAELIAGQVLMIPPQTPATEAASTTSASTSYGAAATATATPTAEQHAHVVRPGETLTSVAAANGVSIRAIAAANGISPEAELIAGQTLIIPAAASSEQSAAGAEPTDHEASEEAAEGESSSSHTVNASYTSTGTSSSSPATTTSADTASSGGPQPTLEHVSSTQIADVADANGVPAALAEAVAWQESGWNNAVVSNVGAVGVMQIVPHTWSWIDRYLTPSNPLGTASATENVRAGVLLLRQLLQLTAGNEQLAVAGYFQGLGSVRRYGMFASTRQYVADVLALAQRF